MTLLDAGLAFVLAVFTLSGFRRGLIVGVLSLAGLIAGAYVGAKIVPGLVGAEHTRFLPLLTFGGAITAAGLGQAVAGLAARSLRSTLAIGPLRAADNLGGAVLGGITGLVLCWVVGAVLLYLPGQTELRRHAQRSLILSSLNHYFSPRELMDALGRVDPFAALAGPEAGVPAPDARILRDPDVVAARRSVVRIRGDACGLGVEGSGWIAASGLVVTNAHVVAGVNRPLVDRRDGRTVRARVVAFDPENDVAVISVPRLRGPVLPFATPEEGAPVALLGFPKNGPYTAVPARIGRTLFSIGRDAYGRFPVRRELTTMRGEIRPGNSGGPAVDASGRVLTTVFAQRAGTEGGYGVPTKFVQRALAGAGTPLDTECVAR